MRIFSSLCCRLMTILVLSGGFLSSAFAEFEPAQKTQRSQTKTKNAVATAYSCYNHLTLMLRGSSFDVNDKLRPSLQLAVERDDGDYILARMYQGRGEGEGRSVGQIGWLVYRPETQSLKDVSHIVENEDRETAFAAENGKTLKIDRRFAYLFDQCRQRHNATQAASCRQIQQQSHIDRTSLSLKAQGRLARQGNGERIMLYSAPDAACLLSHDVVLKAGAALKIYHETDDFYFVRQDGFKRDFITGWILKGHVQDVKFLHAPDGVQTQNVKLIPAAKPVVVQSRAQLAEQSVQLHSLEPEFDVQDTKTADMATTAQEIMLVQEERIPIPLMAKPLPPDMESTPQQRVRRTGARYSGGHND